MQRTFSLLFFIAALVLARDLRSQIDPELNIVGFKFLHYTDKLPDDLLSKRSAVFTIVPDDKNNQRGDWKGMSESAHKTLRSVGIDPVAYYNYQDLSAGEDASKLYSQLLKKREVANIVWIAAVYVQEEHRRTLRFVAVVTPFNSSTNFVDHGEQAWRYQGRTFEEVMKVLRRAVLMQELPRANHLIPEVPEFFSGTNILKGKRYEEYNSDLKIDDLGIQPFAQIEIPQDWPVSDLNDSIANEITANNEWIQEQNQRLQEILVEYPYEYYLAELGAGQSGIFKKGYQYVLVSLNTTGFNVKKMLGFTTDPNESDYITVRYQNGQPSLETLPVQTTVHKFYVKHILTGAVYLGSKWDADTTWEQALINYIENMKSELKIRRRN